MTGTQRLAESLAAHPQCGIPAHITMASLDGWAELLSSNVAAHRIIMMLARYMASGELAYWEGACADLALLVEAETAAEAQGEIH